MLTHSFTRCLSVTFSHRPLPLLGYFFPSFPFLSFLSFSLPFVTTQIQLRDLRERHPQKGERHQTRFLSSKYTKNAFSQGNVYGDCECRSISVKRNQKMEANVC